MFIIVVSTLSLRVKRILKERKKNILSVNLAIMFIIGVSTFNLRVKRILKERKKNILSVNLAKFVFILKL